jgi:predicted ArsR family transcriptional regulator
VDGWWDEIEREIQECVERHGSLTTSELGRHLRMSESAAASILQVLAPRGNVQIDVRLLRDERPHTDAAPRTAA